MIFVPVSIARSRSWGTCWPDTPECVHTFGGFTVQGRTQEAADRLLRDAIAVQDSGAFSTVLEGISATLGKRITRELDIPTIGIGAGSDCDGQVVVIHDMLNLVMDLTPGFAKVHADVGSATHEALKRYCDEVRDGTFPAQEHCY